MNRLIPILATLFAIFIIIKVISVFKDKIKFFSTGFDSGFKVNEINLLWKLAKVSDMEDYTSLFWSLPALDKSISLIISNAKMNGNEHTKATQDFLARLYSYRTKVELNPKNKKGLQNTKSLDSGQKIRVILKGHGVFSAQILNVSRDLVISLPQKDNRITVSGLDWVGKNVSIYLWRKNDAAYVFDSIVKESSLYNSKSALYLTHSNDLLRTQKRKSVRCQCHIYAQMYVIKSEVVNLVDLENEPGLKCLLEDVSEDGALIRIGGKGVSNLQLKIQFPIGDTFVVMCGFVRGVEYNKEKNQSLLHFECTRIDSQMKNVILSYVYNVLPQDEKDIIDAIDLVEKDQNEDTQIHNVSDNNEYSSENSEADKIRSN